MPNSDPLPSLLFKINGNRQLDRSAEHRNRLNLAWKPRHIEREEVHVE